MIADVMLYGTIVALLFALAGLPLERIAAWRRWPRRGIWVAAMTLSVAFPASAIFTPHRELAPQVAWPNNAISVDTPESRTVSGIETTDVSRTVLSEPAAYRLPDWQALKTIERILPILWLSMSVGLVTFYVLLWLRVRLAAKGWQQERMNEQEVWVTKALGPAVYGFIRPIILMPQWALQRPDTDRAFVLAHEQEHIVARDSLLLLAGSVLLVVAPWNVPLWWQFRRLRFSIEVDCDARVLSRGADPVRYGEMLLEVGKRRTLMPAVAIALTEPASQLLRRIRILVSPIPKRGNLMIATAVAICGVCVAFAADLRAPYATGNTASLQPLAGANAQSAGDAGTAGALLKPPLAKDPRQAVMQEAVRSTYPELFSSSAAPGWVSITLLMNRDGTLYKSYKDETQPRPYITSPSKALDAMGADLDNYRDRVQFDMRGGTSGSTSIYVRAFLPIPLTDQSANASLKRPGEPPIKWQNGPAAPNDDPAINRAIAEKYFPDLYTYTTPENQSTADFWVLLDREGRVQATGRRYGLSQGDLKHYLESLYPGIRLDGFQPTELRSDHGRPADVNFLWLAADSPVKDVSKVDLSKRGNVVVYANIRGGGTVEETTLVALRFGSPQVAICDRKDLDLQVTATDGGAGTVILRARIQHVARTPPAEFEFGKSNAIEADWSPESPPLRVHYGDSTTVKMTDQDHNTWEVSLYPDRMQGAISSQ